jgi:hypothetical protein
MTTPDRIGFLSDAWLVALEEVAGASPELATALGDGGPITVEQVVTGAPWGTVRYRFEAGRSGVRVVRDPTGPSDLVLTTDYGVARQLHRGALTAHEAIVAGRLKVAGNPAQILRRSEALAALGDVFSALRDRTSFEPDCSGPLQAAP